MPAKDTGTEQLIKDTAKRIFFAEGKLHATTQDIADAAGVNRTSLHYYFRSRDQLVATVFQESMQALSFATIHSMKFILATLFALFISVSFAQITPGAKILLRKE